MKGEGVECIQLEGDARAWSGSGGSRADAARGVAPDHSKLPCVWEWEKCYTGVECPPHPLRHTHITSQGSQNTMPVGMWSWSWSE